MNSNPNSGNSGPRVVGRPFPKGTSGNPNGRPPVHRDARALARRYTDRAIDTLVELLDCPNPHVRRMAAADLLDRGHGRPDVSVHAAVEMTHTLDADALRARLAARAAALVAGAGGEPPLALPDAPAGRLEIAAAHAVVEVEVAEAGGGSELFTPECSPDEKSGFSNPSVASRNPSLADGREVPAFPLPPGYRDDPEGTAP